MKDLAELLEVLGRCLREAGMDDTLEVTVRDEEDEVIERLGTMKLPETKQ